MDDLFSYSRKKDENGTVTTKINVHPVVSLILIVFAVVAFIGSCEALFG